MERKMVIEDFTKMTYQRLLGFWIMYEMVYQHGVDNPDKAEKIVASFEMFGREAVAGILADAGFGTEDKPVKEVSLEEAKAVLLNLHKENDYRLFSVAFVKREDGSLRQMTARYGVSKGVTGKGKVFEDKDYNLSTVWDINAPPKYTLLEQTILNGDNIEERAKTVKKNGGFRSIALEGLIKMKIAGQEYIITENKDLVHKLSLE